MPITIYIKGGEAWDSVKEEFLSQKPIAIVLEHSLISLTKWEQNWEKPFLKPGYQMTADESIDYIRCMTMTQKVPAAAYRFLSQENIDEVAAYIKRPMTATEVKKIVEEDDGEEPPIMTSEYFYYYMFELGIPYECNKWHLNNLIKLIEVFNCERKKQQKKAEENAEKANGKPKKKKNKMTTDQLQARVALNEKRLAERKAKKKG